MVDDGRLSDEQLTERTRRGDTGAFAVLWARHARAGRAAARHFGSIADPDDIVSEAYLQILRAVQRGGGPREAFRPYLYRTVRNVALRWRARATLVPLDEQDDTVDPAPGPEALTAENTVTVRAFRTLPERWQSVLWYTEVEGMEPAEAAPHLGLTANAAAALAYRAREGLKRSWLQAHVNEAAVPAGCEWTTERMGEYARGSLTRRARDRFDRHLDGCARCTELLNEIGTLDGRLAVLLLPLMLGGVAGAGLLAELQEHGRPAAPTAAAPVAGVNPFILAGVLATLVAAICIALWLPAGFGLGDQSTAAQDQPVEPVGPAGQVVPTRTPTPAPETDPPRPTPPPAAPDAPPRPADPVPQPPVTPTVPADLTPPSAASITAPASGALLADARPMVQGTGEPGAVVVMTEGTHELVRALVDGAGTWSAAPIEALTDGPHTLTIVLLDAAGNRSEAVTLPLATDTVAASPVVDALPPGFKFLLPELTGSAEPGSVVTVWEVGGAVVGTAVTGPDGRWSFILPDPGPVDRAYTTTQRDAAGNLSGSSASTGVVVLERPGVVDPADGSVYDSNGTSLAVIIRFGSGFNGDEQVEIFIDGVTTGIVHQLLPTPSNRLSPPLAPGQHTIAIRYVDTATGRVGAIGHANSFTIG